MASGTITVYVTDDTVYTQDEMDDLYRDMLNECYPMVNVAGCSFDPARVLEEMDPIAYRVGFSDYTDGNFTEVEMPFDIYNSDDSDVRSEWISDNVSA